MTFANMTIVLQSISKNVSLDWINFILNAQGQFLQPSNNTIAMLDSGMKKVGQLVFEGNQPQVTTFNSQNPCVTQLSYNLKGKSSAEIQIFVGIYPVGENELSSSASLNQELIENAQDMQKPAAGLPITTFDYGMALQANSVSYVANRDFGVNAKFAADPEFSLVFINNEVAIFKVRANINQNGG